MIQEGIEETKPPMENLANQCLIQTFNRFYSLMSNIKQLRVQILEEFRQLIQNDFKVGEQEPEKDDEDKGSDSSSSFEIIVDSN